MRFASHGIGGSGAGLAREAGLGVPIFPGATVLRVPDDSGRPAGATVHSCLPKGPGRPGDGPGPSVGKTARPGVSTKI